MPNASKTVLVIDTGNPAIDGHLRDRAFLTEISHTLLPTYELVKSCDDEGIECVTPDAFLRDPASFKDKQVLLLSHLTSDRTDALVEAGAMPFILMCQESPFIATRFYFDFKKISGHFRHIMTFSGLRRQADQHADFHVTGFPIYTEVAPIADAIPFENKKTIALIAGNKSAATWKVWPLKWLYGWSVRLIYPIRRRVIQSLTEAKLLEIYGRGWENETAAVRFAYRGLAPAGAKTAVLAQYKFTLCFENAVFPGYITEKIFDAFLAGSVPVYLGAPDITTMIPKDIFIDTRDLKTTAALEKYLSSMTAAEHEAYRERIASFLQSEAFYPFTHYAFIAKVLDLIKHA